jgi:serine/threonine protein kinase/tetratricopeptide (TPR) repeat protein
MVGQTIGHYRILEKVGAGGMGVVYRAHDDLLERDVAIKFLPPSTLTSETARRRFRREAMALAKLSHPNIETVYEYGTHDGTDFLVMEYVPGKTLAEKLAHGSLSQKEIVALGLQIAAGLAEAHDHGILHRDLKPANIGITAKGDAKVLDFGLARLLRPECELTTDNLSDPGTAAGTLPYMSPEQLLSESVDARSDVYSIGAVLYEMSTNRRAFAGDLSSRVIDAILHNLPVPPRVLNPLVSAELERIILKALEKNPENRFQSTKELCVDLRRLREPLAVPMVESISSSRDSTKRRKSIVYGLAGLILVIGALVTFDFIRWRNPLHGKNNPISIQSLAVLPIENLSGDSSQDYFSEGITDALINDFAQIRELKVISRTSVMAYKGVNKPLQEIARELDVDALVEGSVRRDGDRVHINVQLVQASTGRNVWARSYERDARDIISLQHTIARSIADEIQIKLTPQEQIRLSRNDPVNPLAHEAYLTGRFYWNKRTPQTLQKSIDYLERAVEIDPKYALAYAALADAYHLLPELTTVPANEAFPKARTAALKAIEIDDSLAQAHSALANIKEDYDWDWSGAQKEYLRAIDLDPSYEIAHAWYSNLLLELGKLPDAVVEARKARQLDPLSPFTNDNLAAILYYAGDYEEAIKQCQRTLEIDPGSHQAHRHLAQIYTQKRLYSDAVSHLRKAIELSPGSTEALAELGYVLAVWGKKDEANQILRELQGPPNDRYVSPYHLAMVYAGLGDSDRALQLLQKAVDERSPGVVHLKISPCFDNIRSDRRFQNLLAYIGLSES